MLLRPTVLVQHRYIGLTRTASLLTAALVPRSEIHQTPRTRVCFELQAGKNNTDFYVLRVVPSFRGAQSKSAQRTRSLRYHLLKVVAFIGDSSALTPAKSRSRVISSGHALALYKAATHKLSRLVPRIYAVPASFLHHRSTTPQTTFRYCPRSHTKCKVARGNTRLFVFATPSSLNTG